jgi:hypothetical protein
VPHQLRHAVDDDHGIVLLVSECADQSRRVFAVHHVNDKNNIRFRKVAFDFQPFRVAQRRTEVVSRNPEIQIVGTIDFALRVLQRRRQTRTDIKHRNVHATPSI